MVDERIIRVGSQKYVRAGRRISEDKSRFWIPLEFPPKMRQPRLTQKSSFKCWVKRVLNWHVASQTPRLGGASWMYFVVIGCLGKVFLGVKPLCNECRTST